MTSTRIKIFISSVQKEFTQERKSLRDFLRGDALLRRFFDVFLFEEVPAKDQRADELYLDEVEKSSIYIGILGNEYGMPVKGGLSATHMEFYMQRNAENIDLFLSKVRTIPPASRQ
mgnify:CR=1 FL=1